MFVIRIEEPLLNHMKQLQLSQINIVDIFPLMKEGLSTRNSVDCLLKMLDNSYLSNNRRTVGNCCRGRLVPTLTESKILEEESLITQINKAISLLQQNGFGTDIHLVLLVMHLFKQREDAYH